MFRKLLLLVVAATMAVIIITATGSAKTTMSKHEAIHYKYLHEYWQVVNKFGKAKAGRNIVAQGVLVRGTTRPATDKELKVSYLRLKPWLFPRILGQMTVRSSGPKPGPAHIGVPRIVDAGMPTCTWVPESHGDYTAANPSGAGGKYQMMPTLWHGFGGKEPNASQGSPEEQEIVARRVFNADGIGPWSRAAGGNC